MRNILLRLEEDDELIQIVDAVSKKLGNTNAGTTKLALYEFCNKILNGEENAKTKNTAPPPKKGSIYLSNLGIIIKIDPEEFLEEFKTRLENVKDKDKVTVQTNQEKPTEKSKQDALKGRNKRAVWKMFVINVGNLKLKNNQKVIRIPPILVKMIKIFMIRENTKEP